MFFYFYFLIYILIIFFFISAPALIARCGWGGDQPRRHGLRLAGAASPRRWDPSRICLPVARYAPAHHDAPRYRRKHRSW